MCDPVLITALREGLLVKMRRKSLATLLMMVFFISAVLPVYADELEETRRQLEAISRNIDATQSKVTSVKKQESSIMGQIQSLEKEISSTENQITATEDRIIFLQDSIVATQADIEETEQNLKEKSELLSERLVVLHEQGEVTYLEVLLSATDFKDFLTRYEMVNNIIEQDVDLIASINQDKQDLEMRKSDLEVKKKELENALKQQESMRAQLDEQKAEKKQILTSVQQERAAYEKALQELEETSRQLEKMIRQLQGDSSEALGTGVYTWPTPGYTSISSPYGMRFHPILKQRKMHTGVDIRAPMGATIVAADSGKVIHAGWMGGYGQVLVVDHGNGISTLYAHQSAFLVGNGDTVSRGQAIGKVGSTGWSTGPHLHFEVRINGSYTDPMPYIQ
jgi:murein DD-endopeptidase MepM/ murein hydrolase activator NlpD